MGNIVDHSTGSTKRPCSGEWERGRTWHFCIFWSMNMKARTTVWMNRSGGYQFNRVTLKRVNRYRAYKYQRSKTCWNTTQSLASIEVWGLLLAKRLFWLTLRSLEKSVKFIKVENLAWCSDCESVNYLDGTYKVGIMFSEKVKML